jgi:hypothetical protein
MRTIAVGLTVGLLALAACKEKAKEEVLQQAEDEARFKTEKKSRQVEGVGEGLQGAGKRGAESLSKGVGEVLRGTAKGFDDSLSAVAVQPGAGLAEAGLHVERAHRQSAAAPTITTYVLSDKPFAGTLLLRALDDAGKEVGRTKAAVKRDADDAGYVDFSFDERVPLHTVSRFEMTARSLPEEAR